MLSYRSNPHCGGQGVYVKNLSRALRDLGHAVTVVAGPPDPGLDEGIRHIPLHGLDLYDPADPFRMPTLRELADPVNFMEWVGVCTMGFPEPFTFGLRALRFLKHRAAGFDVLHDNQSLSYGVWALSRRMPTLATIHHPVTIDRRAAVRAETTFWKKLKQRRWYSFIGMQKRVARALAPIITVSECSRRDIRREFGIPDAYLRVVPNGIDTDLFRPLPGIDREPGRIIVTNSADMPLKGLTHLLHAVAHILRSRNHIRLVVIGTAREDGDSGGSRARARHRPAHRVHRPDRRRGIRTAIRAGKPRGDTLGLRRVRVAGRRGNGLCRPGGEHHRRRPARSGGRCGPAGPAGRPPCPGACDPRAAGQPGHRAGTGPGRVPTGAPAFHLAPGGRANRVRVSGGRRWSPSTSAVLDLAPGVRVLDIGCGSGRHATAAYRLPRARVVGVDLAFPELVAAKGRLELHDRLGEHGGGQWGVCQADGLHLPFAAGRFDLVVCSEVLEHVPDPGQAVAEAARVLKPGGHLVVSVPRRLPERICWALSREYAAAEGGHVRIFRRTELVALLEHGGLTAGFVHYAHSLHTPFWWLKCLIGVKRENAWPVRLYHRFLTWDILRKPRMTRFLERLLNPVLGKSLVVYLRKR